MVCSMKVNLVIGLMNSEVKPMPLLMFGNLSIIDFKVVINYVEGYVCSFRLEIRDSEEIEADLDMLYVLEEN